jgi:hypothetical protein
MRSRTPCPPGFVAADAGPIRSTSACCQSPTVSFHASRAAVRFSSVGEERNVAVRSSSRAAESATSA